MHTTAVAIFSYSPLIQFWCSFRGYLPFGGLLVKFPLARLITTLHLDRGVCLLRLFQRGVKTTLAVYEE